MRLSLSATFWVASAAFISIFATAGAPISLFNLYRQQDGLTHAELGQVSLGYFLAAAVALLVFGRLSNFVGRKPMALIAVFSALTSCVLLVFMQDAGWLLAARICQGFACGLATGSVGAYVVDSAERRPSWLVAGITSSSPMMGIPIGAILAGTLVLTAPLPRQLIYFCLIGLLGLCFILLLLSPETHPNKQGAWRSLRPKLEFPKNRLALFVSTAGVVVSTWSLGGFYQAFGPSIVAEQLQTTSPLVSALAFSSVMILTPLGSYLNRFVEPITGIRLGMGLFIVAALGVLLCLQQGWRNGFLVVSLLVGISQGLSTTSCVRLLLQNAAAESRAGLLSTLYVVSYSGAVIPAALSGAAAQHVSVFVVCVGYVVLGCLAALTAQVATLRMPRD